MDYTGILKRAWDVTWRYKVLWVFGLFVGGAGSYGGSGSRTTYGTGGQPYGNLDPTQVQQFLAQYMGVIILGVALLVIFGLIFAVIGIAARGGLIHLVNEAEEGRAVRAGEGWRVGFSKWGRLFGVLFITALPVVVILFIIAFMVGAAAVVALRSGSVPGALNAFGGAVIGGVCFGAVLTFVAIFFAIVLGIVGELAVRYVVLKDMRIMESIKQGWHDLFGHRGAFLMFLVLLVVGVVVGIAIGILQFVWLLAPVMLIVGVPVLIVLGAAYGAFQQAAWTVFFRRMTGMEMVPAIATGAPAAYPGGFPPAPPMAPPAPPSAPVMQAPPAPESYAPAVPPTSNFAEPPVALEPRAAPPAPSQYAPPAPPAPPASEPPPAPTDV